MFQGLATSKLTIKQPAHKYETKTVIAKVTVFYNIQ